MKKIFELMKKHKITSGILILLLLGMFSGLSSKNKQNSNIQEKAIIEKAQTKQTISMVEKKLPVYTIVKEGEFGENGYMMDVYVDKPDNENVTILNEKFIEEKTLNQYKRLVNIRYFDDRKAAEIYSTKILTPEEVDKYFNHWVFNYDKDLSIKGSERNELQRNVKDEWQIVKKY